MGKTLYLLILAASLDPKYQTASDQARRALLETQMMKHEMKVFQDDAEKKLYNYTGLHKDDLVYAAYAYPVFAGEVSSKPFKNFKYESKDHWILRPELTYKFRDHNYEGLLILIKEF
jgi:hypothetical protein